MSTYRRVAALKTAKDFQEYVAGLGISLPFDETIQHGPASPLAQPFDTGTYSLGNRFAILPMEGWDGNTDGSPNELVERRWTRFGLSGAKLIWGCEAVAVRLDGRANPNQLTLLPSTVGAIANLRERLVKSHAETYGRTDDLLIGLQLTHSGRFCRPHNKQLEPAILYRHPLLDKRFHITADAVVMSDDDIRRLIDDFLKAAKMAQQAGFRMVTLGTNRLRTETAALAACHTLNLLNT